MAFGLGLYFLLSSQTEWDAFGAGLVAGGLFLIGPIAGFLISAAVAGLVFYPEYRACSRIAWPPEFLLPITGSLVGIIVAFSLGRWLASLILPVYFVCAVWGALGGLLFVLGAKQREPI